MIDSIDSAIGRPLRYELVGTEKRRRRQLPKQVKFIPLGRWRFAAKCLRSPIQKSIERSDLTIVCRDHQLESRIERDLLVPVRDFYRDQAPAANKKYLALYNPILESITGTGPSGPSLALCRHADFIVLPDGAEIESLKQHRSKDRAILTLPVLSSQADRSARQRESLAALKGVDLRSEEALAVMFPESLEGRSTVEHSQSLELLAKSISHFVEGKRVTVILICLDSRTEQLARKLISQLQTKIRFDVLSVEHFNSQELGEAFSNFSLLVSTNVRIANFAIRHYTPTIALGECSQLAALFRGVGTPELALKFSGLSVESLSGHLEYAWRERARIRCIYEARVPIERFKSRFFGRLVAALDRGEDIKMERGKISEDLLNLEAHGVDRYESAEHVAIAQ